MSGPFGEHDPLLGAGALPPLAGRRVGRGAQVGEGGGEAAAGGIHGFGYGMYVRQSAFGVGAGVFDRRERVLDAVARAVVGESDARPTRSTPVSGRRRTGREAAVSSLASGLTCEGQQVFYP